MFRKNDRVIVTKNGDDRFGMVGTVTYATGNTIDVSVPGYRQHRYMSCDLSSIPDALSDGPTVVASPMTDPESWTVTVEYVADVPDAVLQYDRQPGVTWGNGVIRIDADNDINILQLNGVRRVRVHMA